MDDVDGVSPEAGRELGALDFSALEEIKEAEVELRTGTRGVRDLVSSPKEGLVCGWASRPLFIGVVISESGKPQVSTEGVPSQEAMVLVSRVSVLFVVALDGIGVVKVMCEESTTGEEVE